MEHDAGLWSQAKRFCAQVAQEQGWGLGAVRDAQQVLDLNVAAPNGMWKVRVRVVEEQGYVLFYGLVPMKVEPRWRSAVMEFVTRVNYGLYVGNFEMDLTDGEVRYKTSSDVEPLLASGHDAAVMMSGLMSANMTTMNRYLPGLLAICYGGVAPEEAIRMIDLHASQD